MRYYVTRATFDLTFDVTRAKKFVQSTSKQDHYLSVHQLIRVANGLARVFGYKNDGSVNEDDQTFTTVEREIFQILSRTSEALPHRLSRFTPSELEAIEDARDFSRMLGCQSVIIANLNYGFSMILRWGR